MQRRGKKTLLIIDDEKVFCNTVRDFLESDRLDVLAAHTGAEGLDICSGRKVDVVLLDQKLPDGEGYILAPAILEKNEQAKIIFITAFPSFENAVTAVRAKLDNVLPDDLLEEVAEKRAEGLVRDREEAIGFVRERLTSLP